MPKGPGNEFTMAVVGSGGVGKSCLTIRYLKDEFLSEYDPTIEENFRKRVVLDSDYECTLTIVDTAGQQEYYTLRDQHLRTGQGFLLCFALNDEHSFNEAKELQSAISRAKDGKYALVLVGNKSDLESERLIDTATAKAYADSIKAQYFETSAKNNTGVGEAFHAVIVEMRKNATGGSAKGGESAKKKGGCTLL